MNSTSTSKDILLSVKNVSLSYRLDFFPAHSLKEKFVQVLTRPFRGILAPAKKLTVLDQIEFDLYKGDKVGVLGKNGAGKTTLCRVLSQMLIPESGSIQTSSQIRAIFDVSVGILPELTGRENIHLLAHFLFPELTKEEIAKTILWALEFSELNEFIDLPFCQYSKGMQARLCLSIISARPSDILILDEVFDGADAHFQEKISKRIEAVIKESQAAVIVSHSMEYIRNLCNKVIVLGNHGKIEFQGNLEEGIQFYQKTYVSSDREEDSIS